MHCITTVIYFLGVYSLEVTLPTLENWQPKSRTQRNKKREAGGVVQIL